MRTLPLVISALLGAAGAVGACAHTPCPVYPANDRVAELLEPMAQAWGAPTAGVKYIDVFEARAAVYRLADTDHDGRVVLGEAYAMRERCPADSNYECQY